MAGKRPLKLPYGTWKYPNSAGVLDEVGLKTIAHYIGVRRQHIASYIVDKPIFQTCWDGVRKRGSLTMTERSKRLGTAPCGCSILYLW
jgi:hypothetical protein